VLQNDPEDPSKGAVPSCVVIARGLKADGKYNITARLRVRRSGLESEGAAPSEWVESEPSAPFRTEVASTSDIATANQEHREHILSRQFDSFMHVARQAVVQEVRRPVGGQMKLLNTEIQALQKQLETTRKKLGETEGARARFEQEAKALKAR